MKKIEPAYLALIEKHNPEWIKAVNRNDADTIIMMLDAFSPNEADLLYACLWYAYSEGKIVQIISNKNK